MAALDPKVIYWTFAFINMGFVVGLSLYAVAQIRAGNPARHRRMMLIASSLVVGFLVSYGLKLEFLGREDLSVWSDVAVWTLRFHECCVLVMVVGGALALRWGSRLRATRLFSLNSDDPAPDSSLLTRHRFAGRTAVVGAGLGFVSAGFVLAGMYARMT